MRSIPELHPIEWILQSFDDIARAATPSVHEALGKLQFLNYLLQFGTKDEVGEFVPEIYHNTVRIFNQESFQFIQNSAVARKLRLKLMRNVAKLVLAPGFDLSTPLTWSSVASTSLLLEIMGDNDSLVRLAASKSLSMITQTLDASSAEQVLSLSSLKPSDEKRLMGRWCKGFLGGPPSSLAWVHSHSLPSSLQKSHSAATAPKNVECAHTEPQFRTKDRLPEK